MDKVTGRSDDMIILRGVNVFPTQIEEQVLGVQGLAPHFQIELQSKGRMDNMVVHCECLDDAINQDTLQKELSSRIKAVVGITSQVMVHNVGGIMRSEGKAIRVVDNRKKD